MLKINRSEEMGRSKLGWLNSWFHFSFAEYYNPDNIHYGVLRVLNDDLIEPQSGFNMHPHQNMEIITYVIDGELTHGDNMNNHSTLSRGEVQYMSAGTGVIHSEHNFGEHPLRMLQIWILPNRAGHRPQYGEFRFPWKERVNQWLHLVSGEKGAAPIQIHQTVDLYVTWLEEGNCLSFPCHPDKMLYIVQIEGSSSINTVPMKEKDSLEVKEEDLHILASTDSHILLFEMDIWKNSEE